MEVVFSLAERAGGALAQWLLTPVQRIKDKRRPKSSDSALLAVHQTERQLTGYLTLVGAAVLMGMFIQIVQTVLLVHVVMFTRQMWYEISKLKETE